MKQRLVTQADDTPQDNQIQNGNKLSNQYQICSVVGNGTFGMVYLAIDTKTNEKVAIKKVYQDRRYKNREHLIISELNHPCIVKLRQAFFTQGDNAKNTEDIYLNLVMDYIPETLSKVIRNFKNNKKPFPNQSLKIYSYQMLRALAYLQGIGICHRDIKPQNILVNPINHVLKICDFGSAKRLVAGEPNVAYICSRYYRAPELIFGATEYTTAIDMWSIGCVIAEMLLGEPLFPGESATDQLVEIIKILGTPTIDQIKQMNPQQQQFKFPQIKCHPWAKVFGKFKTEPHFIDFVSKILVYSPRDRLKPLEALLHPYFDEIRQPNFGDGHLNLPNFFDFYKEELQIQPEIAHKLTPSWIKK
ncbi:unnamed protein product [Paramecium primaurelia]|uniref:Protein kinase domain-containing protein n=1 Tax=Paramecium primaurelia TaxID=5886 RepID=A0A8S1Q785_PARPR|nr:unnamed protein product [Paramecium primaurelia]